MKSLLGQVFKSNFRFSYYFKPRKIFCKYYVVGMNPKGFPSICGWENWSLI